jgi:hypothetical protein
MKTRTGFGAGVLALTLPLTAALAHHSYAMFDMSKALAVQGSVAKVEWANPHVFVWLYVKQPNATGKYDLYAFENGPVGILTRFGWTKDTFRAGDRIGVQYFPLRDGSKKGGYFIKAVRQDGSVQIGDPNAPGVASELAKKTPIEVPKP